MISCMKSQYAQLDMSRPDGYLSSILLGNRQKTYIVFTDVLKYYTSSGDGSWKINSYSGFALGFPANGVVVSGSSLLAIDNTTSDTIFLSNDSGANWSSVTLNSGGTAPVSIAACGQKIYVAYGGGASVSVLTSTNGGSSFSAPVVAYTGTAAVGPTLRCYDNRAFLSVFDSGSPHFLYSDGGATWTAASGFTPSAGTAFTAGPGRVVAVNTGGTPGNVFLSTDFGVSFSQQDSFASSPFGSGIGFVPGGSAFTPGLYVAGSTIASSMCEIRTSSTGALGSWSYYSDSLCNMPSDPLNAVGGSAPVLFIGGDISLAQINLYRSTNSGASWVKETLPAGATSVRSIVTLEK